MNDARLILARLRADKRTLRAEYAVRSLALFGSAARGTTSASSDIDLLIEFDRPIGLLHFSRTARHLTNLLGGPSTWCCAGRCYRNCRTISFGAPSMPFEKRKWKFRIRHMLAVIEENRRFVQGMSYPDFCGDATRRFLTTIAGTT